MIWILVICCHLCVVTYPPGYSVFQVREHCEDVAKQIEDHGSFGNGMNAFCVGHK